MGFASGPVANAGDQSSQPRNNNDGDNDEIFNNTNDRNNEGDGGKSGETLFLLPPSDPKDSNVPSIKLGETIRFEEWGPIILNSDGTTRRIANWDQMTEQEKEVTWRRISKRNEQRRLQLLEKMKEEYQEERSGEGNSPDL